MFTLGIGFYPLRFSYAPNGVYYLNCVFYGLTLKKNFKKHVTVAEVIISRAHNIENGGGWFFHSYRFN